MLVEMVLRGRWGEGMYEGVGVSILMKSLDGIDSEGLWAIRMEKRWLSKV